MNLCMNNSDFSVISLESRLVLWWIARLIKLMNLEDMFLPKCSHKINELVRVSKTVTVLHPAYMSISKRNLWLDSYQGLHPIQPDWKQAIMAALFFSKVRKYSIIEIETSSKLVSVLHPAYMLISKRNLWLNSYQGLHPVQPDWKQAILATLFFSKVRKYSIIEIETSTTKKPLTFQKKETIL